MKSFKLTDELDSELINLKYNIEDREIFSRIIARAPVKNPEAIAEKLLRRYSTIENAITASAEELTEIAGERVAVLLKLCGYITSRRVLDKYAFGEVYSPSEIAEYLKALYIGEYLEKVYLLSFDGNNKFISCDFISGGTVNSSEIMPRKLMKTALRTGAVTVSLAHNHPFGHPVASADDIKLTMQFSHTFAEVGIKLVSHYIIAGQYALMLKPGAE